MKSAPDSLIRLNWLVKSRSPRVTLFGDDLQAVFLSSCLESLEATLPEVVIDVNEGDLSCQEILVDEVDEVRGERGVRKRRAKNPLVALRGNLERYQILRSAVFRSAGPPVKPRDLPD